jgi:hypothetical protein
MGMGWQAHRAGLVNFIVRTRGESARAPRLTVRPLRGGLCSTVLLVSARWSAARGTEQRFSFVVKLLEGGAAREVDIYRMLAGSGAAGLCPKLLDVERLGCDRVLLYLERISPIRRWPWRDTEHAGQVLDRAARLHGSISPSSALASGARTALVHEAELRASAEETLEFAAGLPRQEPFTAVLRCLPALRRIVSALPALRRQLLDFGPPGRAIIHGDLHPGNVLVRARGGQAPVLLDWGRARVGSPLEDVCSWLQSLGCWEPEVGRRHDTLLARYLAARGLPGELRRALRDAYWLAGASNALAGALRYQLCRTRDAVGRQRATAARCAGEWMRIIRRADACWSSGAE